MRTDRLADTGTNSHDKVNSVLFCSCFIKAPRRMSKHVWQQKLTKSTAEVLGVGADYLSKAGTAAYSPALKRKIFVPGSESICQL